MWLIIAAKFDVWAETNKGKQMQIYPSTHLYVNQAVTQSQSFSRRNQKNIKQHFK